MHARGFPHVPGPGPVDVRHFHTVWSAILWTSWESRRKVVCRACGLKTQVGLDPILPVLRLVGLPLGRDPDPGAADPQSRRHFPEGIPRAVAAARTGSAHRVGAQRHAEPQSGLRLTPGALPWSHDAVGLPYPRRFPRLAASQPRHRRRGVDSTAQDPAPATLDHLAAGHRGGAMLRLDRRGAPADRRRQLHGHSPRAAKAAAGARSISPASHACATRAA